MKKYEKPTSDVEVLPMPLMTEQANSPMNKPDSPGDSGEGSGTELPG